MSYLILHLSDMHVSESTTLKKPESVVACLREFIPRPHDMSIVISGDIAFSGKTAEYELVTQYLNTLKEQIDEEFNLTPPVIVIPGNHDCSFPDDASVRDLVVANLRSKAGKCESGEMLRHCLEVQNQFFEWAKSISEIEQDGFEGRLSWTIEQTLKSGKKVSWQCLNTAWLSTLDEQQGKLYFPLERVPQTMLADIVISVCHHSFNWLEAINGRSLRRSLDSSSDIIITGHEHEGEFTEKNVRTDSAIDYLEGDIYCDSNNDKRSGFNVIVIDTDKDLRQFRKYTWNGNRFSFEKSAMNEWAPFLRNAKRVSRPIEISDDMMSFLRDPGARFTHRARTVTLEDIFITPNLRSFDRHNSHESSGSKMVQSKYVINQLFTDRHAYLSGAGPCGKTALAKMLFLHSSRRDLVPVYIEGKMLVNPDRSKIEAVVRTQFEKQYANCDEITFAQMHNSKKVIIVDDLFDSRLNSEAKAQICEWFGQNYGYAYIFGGDMALVEEIVVDATTGRLVSDFHHYEIAEFGHLLREKLIEKWLRLGDQHLVSKEEMSFQVAQIRNNVNVVLGKNLVPGFPIFVLIMLQQHEAGRSLSTTSGTYGYFYEVLITLTLETPTGSAVDVDTKYTYLSELSWHLFSNQEDGLDETDFDEFNRKHWQEYRLPSRPDSVIDSLLQSRVLVERSGTYYLAYNYHYCYFVARYMRDRIDDKQVQDTLKVLVKSLHREDYANVIIFLTYLYKGRDLIHLILKNAREIYPDTEPCDLEDHVEFLSRLQESVPQIVFPEGDPDERKEKALARVDVRVEKERGLGANGWETKGSSGNHEDHEMDNILSLNRAYKAMQIMGQILRNFSGSLTGELKQELATECFSVGLRSLNTIFVLLEKNLDGLLFHLAEFLGKNIEDMPEAKRIEASKKLMFIITQALTFATIKRISSAVGADRLMPTYDDVQKKYSNLATELVQTTIRMDHSKVFPQKKVFEVKKAVANKLFPDTILKLLVRDHFYLFDRGYKVKQAVCAKVGIIIDAKMILPSPQGKRKK